MAHVHNFFPHLWRSAEHAFSYRTHVIRPSADVECDASKPLHDTTHDENAAATGDYCEKALESMQLAQDHSFGPLTIADVAGVAYPTRACVRRSKRAS
jgi:hypothetical protein